MCSLALDVFLRGNHERMWGEAMIPGTRHNMQDRAAWQF